MSDPRGLWTIKPSEHAHLIDRAEKAEDERDANSGALKKAVDGILKAQAERDAYRAALEEIASQGPMKAPNDPWTHWSQIARDALAGDHDQGAQT